MLDLHPPLENEKINSELCELLEEWRTFWTPFGQLGQTNGPRGPIPNRVKSLMEEESIAAEIPESESLEKIIEYCTTAITAAFYTGNYRQTIDEINTIFRYFDRKAVGVIEDHIKPAVFTRVLDNIKTGKGIDKIKDETRIRFGKNLTFGDSNEKSITSQ